MIKHLLVESFGSPFQRRSQEDIEILDGVDHIMPDAPADAQVQDIPISKCRQKRTSIKHIVGEAKGKKTETGNP